MKKYFLKETREEVKFGDIIVLDFEDADKNGTSYEHMEVKFTPERVKIFTEGGVVVEKEVKDKGIKFDIDELKKNTVKSKLESKLEELENRITELEEIIAEWDNE